MFFGKKFFLRITKSIYIYELQLILHILKSSLQYIYLYTYYYDYEYDYDYKYGYDYEYDSFRKSLISKQNVHFYYNQHIQLIQAPFSWIFNPGVKTDDLTISISSHKHHCSRQKLLESKHLHVYYGFFHKTMKWKYKFEKIQCSVFVEQMVQF